MPYKFSDDFTSADIGMMVTGEKLQDLFIDSAIGLTEIMVDADTLNDSRSIVINIDADDLDELYHDWLSEIVYLKDAERFLLKKVDIEIFNEHPYKIKATLKGETIDQDRHTLKVDVKAVTYHKFRIGKKDGNWFSEVIFDL
jgi:SHS2 domain-containing protein